MGFTPIFIIQSFRLLFIKIPNFSPLIFGHLTIFSYLCTMKKMKKMERNMEK